MYLFLVSLFITCEASPNFELIGEDTWCQPSDHITSFMSSPDLISPESCEIFCLEDEDAMSFMIREGSPHQCLCHGGPCLEMSQLIDDGVDAYRMTTRVNKECSDNEIFLFGSNGPSDSQCVLGSVLQACYDDQCDTSSCCKDLVSCSTRDSCAFTAHSSTQCVQHCQEMYINGCDCSGGVSCGYVESVGQFGCLADCVKPNATELESFNVLSLVDCNDGEDTMQRETTCDVECKPLHIPETNGLIVCDALARVTVDRCLEPCEVIVRFTHVCHRENNTFVTEKTTTNNNRYRTMLPCRARDLWNTVRFVSSRVRIKVSPRRETENSHVRTECSRRMRLVFQILVRM